MAEVFERFVIPLLFVAIGVLAIVNRREHARETVAFQNRWFRRRYGARETRINERVDILVGIGFIAFGMYALVSGDLVV